MDVRTRRSWNARTQRCEDDRPPMTVSLATLVGAVIAAAGLGFALGWTAAVLLLPLVR